MRRAFIIEIEGREMLCSSRGKIIIATTEKEIQDGPTTHTVDPDDHTITVSEWLADVTGGVIDAR